MINLRIFLEGAYSGLSIIPNTINTITCISVRGMQEETGDRREDTDIRRGEGAAKMEAETGRMRPQAKEQLRPPEEARREKK